MSEQGLSEEFQEELDAALALSNYLMGEVQESRVPLDVAANACGHLYTQVLAYVMCYRFGIQDKVGEVSEILDGLAIKHFKEVIDVVGLYARPIKDASLN